MADDLRNLLETLDPLTRDDLRRVLIRDQADSDAIAMQLMRYQDENGQRWAAGRVWRPTDESRSCTVAADFAAVHLRG